MYISPMYDKWRNCTVLSIVNIQEQHESNLRKVLYWSQWIAWYYICMQNWLSLSLSLSLNFKKDWSSSNLTGFAQTHLVPQDASLLVL